MMNARRLCCGAIAAASLLAACSAFAAPKVEYFPRAVASGSKPYPFSEAVRVGDMLYLSGAIGVGPDGKLVAGGIKAEAKQTMDNIGANLARHGSSFDGVVQCLVALADMKEWADFNEVYKGYFAGHFPARMAYGANGLALDARVEVQCNAVVAK